MTSKDGRINEERWAFLIGDVSGHGPAAAVVMAMFHAIIHSYPIDPTGPGDVLRHVNRHLFAKSIENSFVTAFLGFYEPRTRELIYARAGHNPPLLKEFPHRGQARQLDAVGEIPLGIMEDVKYSESSIVLHPGQTLIFVDEQKLLDLRLIQNALRLIERRLLGRGDEIFLGHHIADLAIVILLKL